MEKAKQYKETNITDFICKGSFEFTCMQNLLLKIMIHPI